MQRVTLPTFLLLTCLSAIAIASEPVTIRPAFQRQCEKLLLETIDLAKDEILVACYSFSRQKIADALVTKSEDGVRVRIKMDKRQSEADYGAKVVKTLKASGVDLELIAMPEKRSMHNKFIIIDNRWVVTGSYNFTNAATYDNWENLVQIEDKSVAQKYTTAWQKIKSKKK